MKPYLLLLLMMIPMAIFATECIPDCEKDTDWTLEVRAAYYDLSSKKIKKIYSDNWIDYQVETAKRITPFWEIWGGVSWARKHGHTRGGYGSYDYRFRDETQMFILPISAGLKCLYPIFPFVDIYAGVGVSYTFLKIKNFCKDDYSSWGLSRSPFRKAIYKNEWGGVFKLGFQYAMSDSTFLDFFADYFLQRFRFSHKDPRDIFKHDLVCDGFKFGVGFGVYF